MILGIVIFLAGVIVGSYLPFVKAATDKVIALIKSKLSKS